MLQTQTAQIKIAPIPEEEGRLFVRALKNKLNPENITADKKYTLSVKLDEFVNKDQGILGDKTATRATVQLTARYILKDLKGKDVINDSTTAMESYNILSAPYATVTAEQESKRRLIEILANTISLRMANYFKTLEK